MLRSCQLVIALLLFASGPLLADDLSGASRVLCSVSSVSDCVEGDDCYDVLPWELNVPRFVVIDLAAKQLKTTEASEERRETPIKNLERSDGLLILQGAQQGRAFSIVITEETGSAAIAMAAEGRSVAIFGACTPAP